MFGLLKRQGKVYVAIIANAHSDTLIPIIRDKIKPDSVVYTDSFRSYDVLDVSEFKHHRINHSKLFADKHNHINPVLRLAEGGIPKQHFHLFIKECVWRFNYRPIGRMQDALMEWWFK